MKAFRPKFGTLPREQKALWPQLKPAKDLGFTLYGGTAIALRLGHRISVDFDFFTDRKLDKNALLKRLAFLNGAQVLQEGPDTYVASVKPRGATNPVKLSFFAEIGFGRFGEPELTDDRVLRVAALEDLMATKIKVILDRTEQRDYEDLAALIQAGCPVATAIAIAAEMFPNLSPQVALQALAFHKDIPKLSEKAKRTLIRAATSVRHLPKVERASHSLSEDGDDEGGTAGRAPAPARRRGRLPK